ncbi:MAG: 2,3,4,5-tetrahydropyridine-2,6-dicarboxylate N-succinyltransferase [Actinomycetota bacterium]|nr:2,3,4,5-tetrahydropyridine-2,6-dicarboxylate N-succinyltransferase [Actinomycetota bacterium]MDQ1383732.1 2,3,4,5-tetrahydropyridine-2,6-dicarboxylate N-succinyltransferase [Actinomycetota bacterium]
MDYAKQVTQLFEAGDEWRDVMALAEARDLVGSVIGMLDRGEIRVAEVVDGEVVVNEPAKHAILMWFRVQEMAVIEAGPFEYVDKLPLKHGYEAAGVRVVPGASARFGSFLARGVVMMPCYVNIGAYVDSGTLVDTWATVASCAQIGKNVHLSGGVGIGGVLEPPEAVPVVVEDDCFIGSRCMIVGGARVRKGAKLGAGLILTATTPVIEADTGNEIARGVVPENAVVVQGTRMKEFAGGTFGLPCALVLRYLPEGAGHDKLQLNAILREHGIVS